MGAFNSESFRIRNSGHFSKIINHHSKFNIDPENFVENIEQFRNQDSQKREPRCDQFCQFLSVFGHKLAILADIEIQIEENMGISLFGHKYFCPISIRFAWKISRLLSID